MRILITGAAGFIASHLIEHIFKTTDWTIVGLDRLDETSTLARIGETDAYKANRHRFDFIWHDLKAPINSFVDNAIGRIDAIFHLAASTHVDRSIINPTEFVLDNVIGTLNTLEFARNRTKTCNLKYLLMNTDEVYGPAPVGVAYKETDRSRPANPYSASKSAAGDLVNSYHNTYGLDTLTVFAMNAVGERQNEEKYLPLLIKKLLTNQKVFVHADPTKTIPTSRSYVHARNISAAILYVINKLPPGDRINIGGEEEIDSLTLAQRVAAIAGEPLKYELVDSITNRPGHDMRYALDSTKLFNDLNFRYPKTFNESLEKTVNWYLNNPKWLGL